ncbi:MAG TPA: hypothetical protein VK428_11450 [Acidimicrobiales bacterium]|nr:hypothetical protein [Acidimicrobiales bacterium]
MSVIEIMAFNLAEGVADKTFLAADSALQTGFAYRQRGIIRRTTGRAADGSWLVITLWSSHDDAEASGTVGAEDDLVRQFVAMIEPATMRLKRFDTLD